MNNMRKINNIGRTRKGAAADGKIMASHELVEGL